MSSTFGMSSSFGITDLLCYSTIFINLFFSGLLMGCFVIIPAYNEQELIGKVIKGAKEYSNNIIVVDDGSKDNTYENAKSSRVIVLKHTVNLGKGAALKTGCEYAFQNGADKVIVMDADTQHDPKEIPKFLEAMENNDLVLGIRKVPD